MSTSAQDPTAFLQRDVGFYGNSIGANYGAVSSSLTLDFATFSIAANRTNKRQNNNVMRLSQTSARRPVQSQMSLHLEMVSFQKDVMFTILRMDSNLAFQNRIELKSKKIKINQTNTIKHIKCVQKQMKIKIKSTGR